MNTELLEKLVGEVIEEKGLEYSKHEFALYERCKRLKITSKFRVEKILEDIINRK